MWSDMTWMLLTSCSMSLSMSTWVGIDGLWLFAPTRIARANSPRIESGNRALWFLDANNSAVWRMSFQKIFVKIYIRLDASHDRIPGGGRSCRHIYTCRRMPAAQQAGPCGSPQEDAGHERRSGTDRQTSPPPRRSSIAATYSAGYIDQLLYQ